MNKFSKTVGKYRILDEILWGLKGYIRDFTRALNLILLGSLCRSFGRLFHKDIPLQKGLFCIFVSLVKSDFILILQSLHRTILFLTAISFVVVFSNVLINWSCLTYNKNRTNCGGTGPSLFHLSACSKMSRDSTLDLSLCSERWNNDGLVPPWSVLSKYLMMHLILTTNTKLKTLCTKM